MRRGQLENQRRKWLCDFSLWFLSVWFFLSEVRLWHLSLFCLERNIKTHQWVFSRLTPAQVACDRRSVQHFPAPNSSIWLWWWVPRFTQFCCHPHPRVFHACEGLGAAKKEAVCVGIWVRSRLCGTGPVVLYRGICPFTEISYQWVSFAQGHPPPFSFVKRQCGFPGNCSLMLSVFQLLSFIW